MATDVLREVVHPLTTCPSCGRQHHLVLQARYIRDSTVVIIGGDQPAPPGSSSNIHQEIPDAVQAPRPVSFVCPVTSTLASAEITLPPATGTLVGLAVVGVDRPQPTSAQQSQQSPDLMELELAEWIKSSAATARDFCKTMVSLSLAAVPLLFAVLKFLGQETAKQPWVGAAGAAAGLLMLASSLIFAAALRPRYAAIAVDEFPRWRAERLRRINHVIGWGSAFMALGMATSIILFTVLLVR